MRRHRLTEALHFLRSYFSDRPSYAIFFPTAVCNARCRHCFYLEEIAAAQADKELPLARIQKIADSLDLIYLSIGGGEPFTRADLDAVVKAFYERSGILYCSISTNGFYVDRIAAKVDSILAGCPTLRLKIQVSIDGFRDEHDKNRGIGGGFDRAMATLAELSKRRSRHPRLTVDVAVCLTKMNKASAGELADFLRAAVPFDNLSFLYPRGSAAVPEMKEVSAAEYALAVGRIDGRSLRRGNNPILAAVQRAARRGILRFLETGERPWRCLAGRKFIHITEHGVLRPCELLSQLKPGFDSTLGRLGEHDFDVRKALASPKAKEVVRFIDETACRCTFECAAMNNVVFDLRGALSVLWTWAASR